MSRPTIPQLCTEIRTELAAICAIAADLSPAARDATIGALQRAWTQIRAGASLLEQQKEEGETT